MLDLRLFFDSLPGFSQQFSLCARVRFQILFEWHFATIFRGWKAAPTMKIADVFPPRSGFVQQAVEEVDLGKRVDIFKNIQ